MSTKAEALWNTYLGDAYASLYNPWVVGIATGTLPTKAWLDYLQQDTFYLSIYEKAYLKAIEMCEKEGDEYHKKIMEDIVAVIRRELHSHVIKTKECAEEVEEFKKKKATIDYTNLVIESYTKGCLSEIIAAVCPCNKLYDFIGHEIVKIFPAHHHQYSDWINIYASDELVKASEQLYEMINSFAQPQEKDALSFYFGEAMRLEYEFFDQQDYVPPVWTISAIKAVFMGHLSETRDQSCADQEEELMKQSVSMKDMEKIQIDSTPMKWKSDLEEMCRYRGVIVSSSISSSYTIGIGSLCDVPSLIRCAIPVLYKPTEIEKELLERLGFQLHRLMYAFQFSPTTIPKGIFFFVEHDMELGMTILGGDYYSRQHFSSIPSILTIAGSDPSGGAGIEADLKTGDAFGVYGMACITAVAVQNTQGVSDVIMMEKRVIEEQIECVCSDIHVDSVKIGVTGSEEAIEAIEGMIKRFHWKTIVLDPVMVSSSGYRLGREDICKGLKRSIIPYCTLITPNLPEAEMLLGRDIPHTIEGLREAARELASLGCRYVLVKGGHLENTGICTDVLYTRSRDGEDVFKLYENATVFTRNSHGTGCTLSSAIAASLAKGETMEDAVLHGNEYVHSALVQSRFIRIGKGKHGPMNHMYRTYTY